MQGKITVTGVKVMANHGVFGFEREQPHPFIADAVIYTDITESDRLQDTCDYGEAARILEQTLSSPACALVETLAAKAARALARYFKADADVTVHKPEAPIEQSFADVSVSASARFARAYLSLGSSMGDRRAFILRAFARIRECADICEPVFSSLYATSPYGGAAKGEFLNACAGFDTLMSPTELLAFCRRLEEEAGRTREVRWGDRTLDADILLYADKVVSLPELLVPHEDMCAREFVLAPLNEIAPYAVHPQKGRSVRKLLEELRRELPGGGTVLRVEKSDE